MPPKTASGANGAASGSTTDINTLLPLLFAANPDFRPDYKKMVAIDPYGRTYAALEHKFRNWRQKGRELRGASSLVGDNGASATERTKAKRSSGSSKVNDIQSGDLSKGGPAATEKSSKKRSEPATKADNGSPKKRARGVPKGMAKVEDNVEATVKDEADSANGMVDMEFV